MRQPEYASPVVSSHLPSLEPAVEKPLRILLVANTLPPRDLSGVGEQVLQLAAGLEALGHDVRILGRRERGPGGVKLLFPLTIVPALRRVVRGLGVEGRGEGGAALPGGWIPQVVQVHESDGGLAAAWLHRWRRRRGEGPVLTALLQVSYREERRAVRTLRDPEGQVLGRPGGLERRFRRLKAPLHVALGRLTARRADRVFCPSARTAREVARDYRVPLPGVVPNVTGGRVRAPARTAAREGRRPPDAGTAAELTNAEGALLFVGRLRLRKGVEVLLEALARWVRRGGDPPPLLVVGDGEHRSALERAAARRGLGEDRVRFLGRRDPGAVRALLARCRALVVPSIYEGMPLVVLEAMEAARPVVASAVSGIPEVVMDGETGWLVAPEDPDALARALAELTADPSEAARRGAAGRRRVEEWYRPRVTARRWLEEVAELVDGTGAPTEA